MRHEKYTKTTGTKPRVKLALAAMLLFAGAVAGCNGQAQQKQPDPPQVIVAKPERDAVTDYEEFTGHTEAVNSVTVRAMVTGRLETVCFVEGAPVAEGDKLFLIDEQGFPGPVRTERGQSGPGRGRI